MKSFKRNWENGLQSLRALFCFKLKKANSEKKQSQAVLKMKKWKGIKWKWVRNTFSFFLENWRNWFVVWKRIDWNGEIRIRPIIIVLLFHTYLAEIWCDQTRRHIWMGRATLHSRFSESCLWTSDFWVAHL